MRLERQDAARKPQFARLLHQALEHRAMAAVHAVKIADREPHGTAPRPNDPVRDLHKRV
jgi:hypothetical protein